MAYTSTNPYTTQVLQRFDEIGAAEVEQKLSAAQGCFDTQCRDTCFEHRRAVVSRASALVRERAPYLAELITLEMGKLIRDDRNFKRPFSRP